MNKVEDIKVVKVKNPIFENKVDKMNQLLAIAKCSGGFRSLTLYLLARFIAQSIYECSVLNNIIYLIFGVISFILLRNCNSDLEMSKMLYFVAEDLKAEENNSKQL